MRRAFGLVALVVTLGVATGCGSDPHSSAGAVVKAGAAVDVAASAAATTTLTVPVGTITLALGDPVTSVDGDKTAGGNDVEAPDGGELVPVGWSFATRPLWGGMLALEPHEADVSLVVDGKAYPLGSPYSVDGNALANSSDTDFYLAIPGKPQPKDLTVRVDYDGGAQEVAVGTGKPVAGSRDLATLGEVAPAGVDCPSTGWSSSDPKLDLRLDCRISMVGETPYYPGVGWAPAGKVFRVVNVPELRLLDAVDNSGTGSTTYRVAGIVDHSTLAGGRSATALRQASPTQEYVAGGTLVFRTAADAQAPLRLSVAFRLEEDDVRGGSKAPDTRTVTITRKIPLR